MSKPYDCIIGQEGVKTQLIRMLGDYEYSRYFSPVLIMGPSGAGKTTIVQETAKYLWEFDEVGKPRINAATHNFRIKPFVKITCSSLTNVTAFFNDIIIPHVQNKDVTVFFDEASEIPTNIAMAMLDIFNTTDESTGYRTTYEGGAFRCEFDLRRQSFLFATSEPNKIFHALKKRLERISLQDYSRPQLAAIIKKKLPDITFEGNVLDDVATVIRDCGRGGHLMAIKIKNFLRGSKVFMKEDWTEMKRVFNIYPLGVDVIEVQILRFLSEKIDGTSLTALSAKTSLTPEALRREHELFLMKHGLMEVKPAIGRLITTKGRDYLKALPKNCPA